MSDVHDCLTAWRQAERLRDTIPRESADWDTAEQEVHHARLIYQATIARCAARYQEADEPPHSTWWPALGSIRTRLAG